MAGTWQPLANQPTFGGVGTMYLLTDGTVMSQAGGSKDWWRLTPDASGDYVNGTWSKRSSGLNSRLYYAAAVLADGRLLVAGGEYSDAGGWADKAEIYNPVLDFWTAIPTPGWGIIGDASSCLLADGRFLLGDVSAPNTSIYDPVTNAWTATGAKAVRCDEESWALLPDGTVVTIETMGSPNAEKYVPTSGTWVTAGATPVQVVQTQSAEIGPAILLPDGRAFFVGATGHTALYTPPANPTQAGTWTAGPDIPPDSLGRLQKAKDAPGCLLPNGNVLISAGPGADDGSDWPTPAHFFEFDPAANTITAVPDPANNNCLVFQGRMILLPTGQVLYGQDGSAQIYVYDPAPGFNPAWKPVITAHPHHIYSGHTYTLLGRQFNGMSQAVSYGDDAMMATNYPLVRLDDLSGGIFYCRTFDHSTMGVATGNQVVSTRFKVPFGLDPGFYELCVVANGISSDCVVVRVGHWRWHYPFDYEMVNHLIGSLADGPLWVLGPHGPVPVDPYNGRLKKQAKDAYKSIRQAVKELQRVGRQVVKLRAKARSASAGPKGERRPHPRTGGHAAVKKSSRPSTRRPAARRKPRG